MLTKQHKTSERSPLQRRREGFALILALALLSLVALLVVSLSSIVAMELRNAELRKRSVLAREHARLGLDIALGELKKHAGADRRVTSSAGVWAETYIERGGEVPPAGGRSRWTGVWKTGAAERSQPPAWLVSGENPDPFRKVSPGAVDDDNLVELVSSTGADPSGDDAVLVEKVPVSGPEAKPGKSASSSGSSSADEPELAGAFAYWVGDESLKAKINLRRTDSSVSATGFGVSVLPGFAGFEARLPAKDRSKLLNLGSVASAANAVDEQDLRKLFHDVTVHGHGVLADVKGGGLRRDLSAGLQPGAKGASGELVLTGDEQIFGPVSGGAPPSSGGGYIPRVGFPELEGYEIDMGSSVGRLPFNPANTPPRHTRRVALRESTADYYCIDFEDWTDYDWDVRIEAQRMSEGNIRLSLYHPSNTCFKATVYDNLGQPIPEMTRCSDSGWRTGRDRRVVTIPGGVGNGTGLVSTDPGGPLWDQLRDYYNLRPQGGSTVESILPRAQMEDKVGVHPVISRAQFFLYPTSEKLGGGEYRINSHVMPAIVLWNPFDVDIAPSNYTVGLWCREMNGLGDKYRIYYNDRNICEKNYYRWRPRKKGGPEGEIINQGKAGIDIKGVNPEPGYPNARWTYINTDGHIGVDLIGPCREGKIWTILDTVPGETYEIRFPFGINKDDRPKPYKRRGIVSWDGTDMSTFEGNTDLFTYGTPQDYVSFSAVATREKTRLQFRSDSHTKAADGGFVRHGGRTCQGVTVGVCTVKSASGYPASVKISTEYAGLMNKKIGFVLENTSGLKAGQALVFTPSAEGRYAEYEIGQAPGNVLKEGWNGGHTFWKPTSKTFDADAKPTHAEVLLDQNDTYLVLFKDAADTDSSFNDPLSLLSLGRFKDDGLQPEQFALRSRKRSGRYTTSELAGAVGRRYVMRYVAGEDDSLQDGRIRWLANYNPRASLFSPTPYEHSIKEDLSLTGSLQTIPNYRTGHARVSDDEWEVPVAGSGSADSPFVAYSHLTGAYRGTFFEIPKGRDHRHFHSLAQFAHADFSTKAHRLIREYLTFENGASYEKYAMRGLGHKPTYAIGNSLADPRIPLDVAYANLGDNPWAATENHLDAGYHYDHSYLLNEALWDSYFLSTVPRTLTDDEARDPAYTLSNSRLFARRDPRNPPTADDLLTFDTVAEHLVIDGAFNVNSTSVHAWSALLASFFGAKVDAASGPETAGSDESPFPRMNRPAGSAVKGGDGGGSSAEGSYVGYRVLDQSEITELASQIVAQVKKRGPFRSFAEFVNRTLPDSTSSASSDWEELALSGALQAAIDATGINERFEDELVGADAHRNFDLHLTQGGGAKPGGSTSAAGSAASHVPGYLTQADLLARLGPCLTVRSDIFRIRVHGEASEEDDGRTRCEAILQRMPEPGSSSSAGSSGANWSGSHRRFTLVGFRWLREDDI